MEFLAAAESLSESGELRRESAGRRDFTVLLAEKMGSTHLVDFIRPLSREKSTMVIATISTMNRLKPIRSLLP